MKQLTLITLLLLLFSCSDIMEKPENLVEPDTMSEIIAEFALSNNLHLMNVKGNVEVSTKYILDQHKIKGKDFTESYSYYLSKPKQLERIFDKAQEIITKKDPKAKDFIKEKTKGDRKPEADYLTR